jgi:hypothetical protein
LEKTILEAPMETIESTEMIKDIVTSERTKETARFKKSYFTRNRKMPFAELVYFMLNPAKECTQIKLILLSN